MNLQYADYFNTGIIPEGLSKEILIADSLGMWACIMAGTKPPTEFGKVMAEVSSILDISATPENLSDYADKYILNVKEEIK
jgi:hypothetical protein